MKSLFNNSVFKILKINSKKLKQVIKDNMQFSSIRGVENYIEAVRWQISEERWDFIPQVLLQVFSKEDLRNSSTKDLMLIYATLSSLYEEITECK